MGQAPIGGLHGNSVPSRVKLSQIQHGELNFAAAR